MPENLRTWIARMGFNLFPAYCATGARIVYIADDWHEVRIKLPLSWRTRNYVGTIFGGSMYGAVDPIYMVMLIKILGPGYVVWDKAASIRFRKPGNGALYARFALDKKETDAIRQDLAGQGSVERVYHVDLVDREGDVRAAVEKVLYVRKREGRLP